ncbi:hypothetical protein [Pelagerythrobacter marinus]|uniref:hypothetical protein n=1 Tax=Pelagerythrobacter marinus TaxID=538382 RepID=UPI002AC9ACA8|nr:hypothetical protein [Pelagerythrobacter marinus]WPZ05507.1 hypothetical protein T8T98_08680 [Pelagerythrobacter marinus]
MKVLVRDSRTCFRCGAIYGRCEHTHGKVDNRYIEMPDRQDGWKESEIAALIAARREGLSYSQVGRLLNRTKHAAQAKGQSLGL